MTIKRRRFKQTTSLQERLAVFARDLRKQASTMPAGAQRDDVLKRAGQADTAAHIDDWATSTG